jgi:hypothetical protein
MTDSKYDVNPWDIDAGTPSAVHEYTLEIWRDDDSENPWANWDCMTPLIADGGDGAGVSTHDGGADLARFFNHVSPAWVSRHWRKVAAILSPVAAVHDADARDNAAAYGMALGDARRELFAEELDDARPADVQGILEQLYTLLGWPAVALSRHGYSQGDSVDLLFVATPAHVKACGYDPKKHDYKKDFAGSADLYAAWVFGDVYGFTVTHTATGDDVDTCGGFYGAPYRDPHILQEASGAMASDAATRARDAADSMARDMTAARPDMHATI